ncbi:MAG: M20/M25/M40 family metallo-hydrolase [Gemmatimonadetes bacterium]|nr:M20/M25/M40 family metallo-hydrolase [Gemmatimonadota bacterium]
MTRTRSTRPTASAAPRPVADNPVADNPVADNPVADNPVAGDPVTDDPVVQETIEHLQALIRLDSSNPPGNELAVARYLDGVLRAAGIDTWLDEPAPERGALIARIRGDGTERPLLLMAHMDVVGVEPDKWTYPPFGAEVHGGFLYGRGAIDDKGMLACHLVTMLLVRRAIASTGRLPTRDIVLVATADEEAGGIYGIDWVMEHRKDLIDAEFALNEGGRVRIVGARTLYAAVQCAEKVPHNVIVTARGPGGHASVPHAGNAITRLVGAVARIAAHQEPLALSEVTRTFFRELSAIWPDAPLRQAMADVASGDPARVSEGARALSHVPSMDAVLRNGISPTLISGGTRSNVIPTEAEATLNIRTLPGVPIDAVLERLRAVVDDPHVTMRVRASGDDAPESAIDSPMFRAVADAAISLEAGIVTVPYLSTGATDSATLRKAGIACYGILPFPLTQEDEDRMHGHDERVGIDALGFGVRLVHGIVARMTGLSA